MNLRRILHPHSCIAYQTLRGYFTFSVRQVVVADASRLIS